MKRIFFVLAIVLLSHTAQAWEIGDYYNLDGVPSIVVWVDSTGEHGLRMSPQADFYENGYYISDVKVINDVQKMKEKGKKLNKTKTTLYDKAIRNWQFHEQYEDVRAWQQAHTIEIHKTKKAIDVTPLLASNSDMGEINMKAIIKFCEDNNYDMQTYFPAFYWATTIGDTWFIPGSYEADLISKITTEGIGIEQNNNTTHHLWVEYIKKVGYYLSFNVTGGAAFDIRANILTSTMILSDWTKDQTNFNKLIFLTTKPKYSDRATDYDVLMKTYSGNQTHLFLSLCLIENKNKLDPNINNWKKYYLLYENLYEKYKEYDYTKFDGTAKIAVSYF